jgi:probable O-glycosylation ligase (exosortase A-associated)
LGHRFVAVGVIYRAVTTYSRGGFLALAALGSVFLLRSKHRLAAGLGVAAVGLLVFGVMPQSFWDRMGTIGSGRDALASSNSVIADEEEPDNSIAGRIHFWGVAASMASARPLVGVGHSSYNIAYNDYDSSNGRFGRGRSVHSVWFGILGETGYPGLLLFIAILVVTLRSAAWARRQAASGAAPPELGHYGNALEAGLIAFMVGGTFVPMAYNEMIWHFVGLGVALRQVGTAAAVVPVPQPGGPTARPRWAPQVATAAATRGR